MIRRTPTRIELKLDDIAEYHNIRNNVSTSSEKDQQVYSSPNVPGWSYKVLLQNNKNLSVAERIGYVPQPRTPT